MVDMVKEPFDVCFHHPFEVSVHHLFVDKSNDVMRTAVWSEPVGAVQKPGLVNLIEDVRHHTLYQPIFIGRYAQRSQFAVSLRDVYPSDWLWNVLASLHATDQILQVWNQVSDASVNFHFDATRSFHLKIGKIK